jgi:hypothetical protein
MGWVSAAHENSEKAIIDYLDQLSREELLSLVKEQVFAPGLLRRKVLTRA